MSSSSSANKPAGKPGLVDSKLETAQNLSTVEDSADHLLETLGYTPELSRNRSTAQVAFMSFVLASIPYGLATTLYYPLVGGGPVDIIWGWVLVSLIIVCVAVSLGEITSVYPTAGGNKHLAHPVPGQETRTSRIIVRNRNAQRANSYLVVFLRCLLPSLYAGLPQVAAHRILDHRLALCCWQHHNHSGRKLWHHALLRLLHQCV